MPSGFSSSRVTSDSLSCHRGNPRAAGFRCCPAAAGGRCGLRSSNGLSGGSPPWGIARQHAAAPCGPERAWRSSPSRADDDRAQAADPRGEAGPRWAFVSSGRPRRSDGHRCQRCSIENRTASERVVKVTEWRNPPCARAFPCESSAADYANDFVNALLSRALRDRFKSQ